jgi:divalent metal cation (Fe/Co/Zn/Cd) transporter
LIFFNNSFKPDLKIAIILLLVLLLKGIVVKLLQYFGKRYKSELMIEASTESKADFISTCVVLGVLGLSFLEKYIPEFISIDKIGSFGMAIYVFYTAIKMMIYNIRGILANDEDNSEIKDEIEKELSKIKEVEFLKVKVIKMSTYYSVFLQVKVDENMTMKEFVKYEKKLKMQIKNSNKLIRFIDIEPM